VRGAAGFAAGTDDASSRRICIEDAWFTRAIYATCSELFSEVNKNHEHDSRNHDLHEAPIQPDVKDIAVSTLDIDE
jgi:hypothetical protein